MDPAELFSKAPTEKKEANPKLTMVKFLQVIFLTRFILDAFFPPCLYFIWVHSQVFIIPLLPLLEEAVTLYF